MAKSADAFRTISEVAEWLDLPTHVLRFWESKFTQVKPVKRAGGRRYYRPNDMLLLGGIKKLLHDDGMTIKGAQKVLREQGVKFVSGLSRSLEGADELAHEVKKEEHASAASAVSDLNETDAAGELVSESASETNLETDMENRATSPSPSTDETAPDMIPDQEPAEVLNFRSRSTEIKEEQFADEEQPENTPESVEQVPAPNEEDRTISAAVEPALTPPTAAEPREPFESSALPSFLRGESENDTSTPPKKAEPLSIVTPEDASDTELEANAGILSRLAASKAPLSAETRSELTEAKNALMRLFATA
ncbi:MerR family transcriptional regulator [Lentibacter algarum]|uniref:MerR family transcriptional regulator n=1 Tax=Lentibacter algarum TaxID=576131 RepID=UPI0020903640|nr:MerR family transcriptional regulator [Lentibacter algarum]